MEPTFVLLRAKLITLLSSLGRKSFENLHLTSGLKTFVGGLEIELDSRVTRAEFPQITGSVLRTEHEDETQELEENSTIRSRANDMESSGSPIKNSNSSGMKFIPPTTFYAKTTPKTKSAVPL